jgi:heme/copper-type cytochrome/quinol oxidase subunit 2
MVNRAIILVVVVVAVLAVSAGYYVTTLSGGSSSAVTVNILVTSGTPQNGAPDEFVPQNFTVTEGQHVTIVFDNTDDGPHAYEIPALGVSTGIVQGGQTVRVSFVPTKSGTFSSDQPPGACVSAANPTASCTGAQLTNGFVTVLPG